MKSDKMPNIICADIDMQIIQKILQQQKWESIFLVDIQYQLYGLLII